MLNEFSGTAPAICVRTPATQGNLAPPYVHSFQWDMDIEQSKTSEKRPAASRSEAMRAAWEKRRATAALEKESLARPVCCCGCGARLDVAKNPEQQRFFRPGHDSALKSLLRKINRGEAKRDDIPQAARANLARIKFIQADEEFPGIPKGTNHGDSHPIRSGNSSRPQLQRHPVSGGRSVRDREIDLIHADKLRRRA
jgi:hypothetical protein